ncbi:MAG: serine racemase VanT catalytic subunit [Coriobacteriia bacterium]|nr:serine racemase VanT catalytic subunit [Coriobacteriia bacterium]
MKGSLLSVSPTEPQQESRLARFAESTTGLQQARRHAELSGLSGLPAPISIPQASRFPAVSSVRRAGFRRAERAALCPPELCPPAPCPPFQKSRAWIELDMGNLRHNVGVLRNLLPDTCELMPAVKADAYGHGAVLISKELNAMGIRSFCVASAAEGVELREHGIQGDILVLGYTHLEQFLLLRRYRLTQTVVDYCHAKALSEYGGLFDVHIKIDTGMHRLGERADNIDDILRIFQFKNLIIRGIYTHLCTDDGTREIDKDFTRMQVESFYRALDRIREEGFAIPKTHILNSYGVFNYPELACDYARVGIALYGMLCTFEDSLDYTTGLRPVLSVKARVSAVKTIHAGETVGYGLVFTALHEMRIAVVAIGYADGVPRNLSCGAGAVLINGQRAPIVGRVCMDQMMVDITHIDGVQQGDIAVVIGRSEQKSESRSEYDSERDCERSCENNSKRDSERSSRHSSADNLRAPEITACEVARQAGTISNEILSRLGARLERH